MRRQCFNAIVWSFCLLGGYSPVQAATAAATQAPSPAAPGAADKAKDKDKTSSSKSAPEELKFIGSVFYDNFNDSTKFGTDVFFPGTKRFVKKVDTGNSAAPAKPEAPALSQFVLKGISGNGSRRLAVINNRTVGQGEILELKHNGQSYRVKCEQIKPRSVILSIEGFPDKKEIQLRDGL